METEATIRVDGREFTVSTRTSPVDGRVIYTLHGKRGARYTTLRNVPNPELMLLFGTRGAPNVWLTDKKGTLEAL